MPVCLKLMLCRCLYTCNKLYTQSHSNAHMCTYTDTHTHVNSARHALKHIQLAVMIYVVLKSFVFCIAVLLTLVLLEQGVDPGYS